MILIILINFKFMIHAIKFFLDLVNLVNLIQFYKILVHEIQDMGFRHRTSPNKKLQTPF